MSKIAVIQGHPDALGDHLCDALAQAYVDGAKPAGDQVEFFDLGQLNVPFLRTQKGWEMGISGTPRPLIAAQSALVEASHIVFISLPMASGISNGA